MPTKMFLLERPLFCCTLQSDAFVKKLHWLYLLLSLHKCNEYWIVCRRNRWYDDSALFNCTDCWCHTANEMERKNTFRTEPFHLYILKQRMCHVIEVLIHVFTIAFLPAVQQKHAKTGAMAVSKAWSPIRFYAPCLFFSPLCRLQRSLEFILINHSIMLRIG